MSPERPDRPWNHPMNRLRRGFARRDLVGELVEDSAQHDEPRVAIPADMPDRDQVKTFKPWANYVTYRRRYGVWPIWNAVAGQQPRPRAPTSPRRGCVFPSINSQYYVTKATPWACCSPTARPSRCRCRPARRTCYPCPPMDGAQANASAADEAKRLLAASAGRTEPCRHAKTPRSRWNSRTPPPRCWAARSSRRRRHRSRPARPRTRRSEHPTRCRSS